MPPSRTLAWLPRGGPLIPCGIVPYGLGDSHWLSSACGCEPVRLCCGWLGSEGVQRGAGASRVTTVGLRSDSSAARLCAGLLGPGASGSLSGPGQLSTGPQATEQRLVPGKSLGHAPSSVAFPDKGAHSESGRCASEQTPVVQRPCAWITAGLLWAAKSRSVDLTELCAYVPISFTVLSL